MSNDLYPLLVLKSYHFQDARSRSSSAAALNASGPTSDSNSESLSSSRERFRVEKMSLQVARLAELSKLVLDIESHSRYIDGRVGLSPSQYIVRNQKKLQDPVKRVSSAIPQVDDMLINDSKEDYHHE
jgi:hypothetical protein